MNEAGRMRAKTQSKQKNINPRRTVCPRELENETDRCVQLLHECRSETAASVEKFESYPLQKTTAQRTSTTLVRDPYESSTSTARRVGPSSRCAEDLVKTRSGKRQQVGGIWTLGGVQRPNAGELHAQQLQTASGRTCGSTLICG